MVAWSPTLVPIVLLYTLRGVSALRNGITMVDYPRPTRIETTSNFREAAELSTKFMQTPRPSSAERKTVAVVGGGLSGLACAKYITDTGHRAIVLEARDVLGGKVSAW